MKTCIVTIDKFGATVYHLNGKRHREDGPVCKYADGSKKYCFLGKVYPEIKTDKQWSRLIKLINFS